MRTVSLALALLLISSGTAAEHIGGAPEVSILDGWVVDDSYATQDATFNVSAGTDRLVLVALSAEKNRNGPMSVSSVSLGDQVFTEVFDFTVGSATAYHNLHWLGYLLESQIAARTGSALTIEYTNAPSNPFDQAKIHYASYENADQKTPIAAFASNSSTHASSLPLSSALTADDGDKIVGFNVLGQHYAPGLSTTGYTEETESIGATNGHASAVYHRTAITSIIEDPTFASATATRMAVSAVVLNAAGIDVSDVNPPTQEANSGSTVLQGGTDSVTSTELLYIDQQPASSVAFMVTTAPFNGQLELISGSGTAIIVFTQADIDAGSVVYVHDGSNTISDAFTFTVGDGLGNALSGETFDFTVTAGGQQGGGPVPGSISEEIDLDLANAQMSAVGNLLSGFQINVQDPERANQFAFEGSDGADQTENVAFANINTANLQSEGGVDVPTGSAPSRLFGAQPFTQQMLRFEEFGPVSLGPQVSVVKGDPFPPPMDAISGPDEQDLDDFLDQYISDTEALPAPFPTRLANDPDNGGTDENPWKTDIEAFLGRSLVTPPAEGRPPGEDWAHQRWDEFFPEVFFITATAGARVNGGLRDRLQLHTYSKGEFAAGGLYHNTTGNAGSEGTTKKIPVQFHPNFPEQDPMALWTFDGTFPPKLLMARYGEPILLRHYNALPIDPSANFGFGLHTLTTHEHNGHTPAESDGYTQAFFYPGQFYDYRWPMVLAGHDSINTDATDPRAGAPDGAGGIITIQGDWQELMSSHWFHDHMLDFTASNVYKGGVAMMNYYSSVDRGNEAIDDGVNLRFPSGTDLDWGNRDYDINLLIADKAWDQDGQLFFNIFNTDGYLGDQMLTNWLWKPYMDVRARRYRFRILNGSVSRYFRIALVEQVDGSSGELDGPAGSGVSYNRVPFYMILNDGNIMEHAVYFNGNTTVGGLTNRKGILPTLGIAERYDIVVDFSQFIPGTKLYMVNLLEHHNGKRPHEEIPLEDVLDGSYAPEIKDGGNETDPTVTKFLEFRVQFYGGIDMSMDPASYVAGQQKMIPLPEFTQAELDNAIHRTFEFGRSSGTDRSPWTIKTDDGAGFAMDPRRLSASPTDNRVEIWHIEGNGGWSHPIHVHFEEGQIIKRGGVDPPEWEQWARKDVYRIGRMDDSTSSVDIAIRFREFLGTFMEHCHNTQHEDHAMLLRWDVENPGQVRVMPTPMPTWDGVGYVPSFALPTFRVGDLDVAEDAADDPDFGHLTN